MGGIIYTSSSPNHSLAKELDNVHKAMINKYNLGKKIDSDIQRAKTMEKYLRAFKQIGNNENQGETSEQSYFNQEAMKEVSSLVGKTLGINGYSLFKNPHFWYGSDRGEKSSQKLWGSDDVFEAELQTFLNVAIEKATYGNVNNTAELVGNLPGNISEKFMGDLSSHFSNKINKKTKGNILIKKPEFKSGKVDVTSFKGSINTTINPIWEEFYNAFKDARFTVKNYMGTAKTEVIHLGNTNIAKSILGTLDDVLGDDKTKESLHIFYHTLYHLKKKNTEDVKQHVFHLRFAYELSGNGLKDQQGNNIQEADFFIYNDPTSNNIYVRSTKEMISNATKYMKNIGDPLHSDIVILKSSF